MAKHKIKVEIASVGENAVLGIDKVTISNRGFKPEAVPIALLTVAAGEHSRLNHTEFVAGLRWASDIANQLAEEMASEE